MSDLRALTVRQPFADLIMAGVKDVENRSWPAPFTLPQWQRCNRCGRRSRDGLPETVPVVNGKRGTSVHWHDVCAPRYDATGDLIADGPFPFRLGIHAALNPERADHPAWTTWIGSMASGLAGSDERGALLGTVEVTGCHHADECLERTGETFEREGMLLPESAWCSRWAEPDAWHWALTDPQPLDVPIPMRGMLGLWRLPEGVSA